VLAREGARLHAVALPGKELESLSSLGSKGQVACYAGDITDAAFVNGVVERVERIDVLIQCAGITRVAPFLEMKPDDWDAIFRVNVLALLSIVQQVARRMVAAGSGHIILVSSALAASPLPNTLAYVASKRAVSAIHDGLRTELAPHGIRTTELRPGAVGGTRILDGAVAPGIAASFVKRDYALIRPDDIARALLFVAKSPPGVNIDVIEVKPLGQP
jgi:NADP-dependent 3-hydroxy acid dehydrogenase YdfG